MDISLTDGIYHKNDPYKYPECLLATQKNEKERKAGAGIQMNWTFLSAHICCTGITYEENVILLLQEEDCYLDLFVLQL